MNEYNEGTEEHFNYFEELNDNFEKYRYCLKYPKLRNPYSFLISGLNNQEYLCFEELFKIEDCYILISIYRNIYIDDVKIPLLFKIRKYIPEFGVEEKIKDERSPYFLIISLILILIFK